MRGISALRRAALVAPAKLNVDLRIVGRRSDGYHLLDSIAVPISLFDQIVVEVQPAAEVSVDISCVPEGLLPDAGANLAHRAATLFLDRTRRAVAVKITVAKRIPIGAGLGGGSSDAAATLQALNVLLECGVPRQELSGWGLELGADVPFFLLGEPARMRAVGEHLDPLVAPIGGPIVVAFPGVGLDTAAVYRAYDGSLTSRGGLSSIRALTPRQESPRHNLVNDLEAAAFQIRPEVKRLRRMLGSLGAEGVLMTGSGSAVFGVWRHWDDARAVARHLHAGGVWARVVEVLQQTPTLEVVQ